MKTILIISMLLSYCGLEVFAQYVNIPDPKFKAALVSNSQVNTDANTEISFVEARAYSGELYIQNDSIRSLVGIEAFVNIVGLYCDNNQLTQLDVRKNVLLTYLDCSHNLLSALDISANTALNYLYCTNNQIAALDATNQSSLYFIDCSHNLLTILKTKNVSDAIYCSYNNLTSFDFSASPFLYELFCTNNQLTTLNLSANIYLDWVDCSSNQLTILDVSNNINMASLYVSNNQLLVLDVRKNSILNSLDCSNNQLTTLDVNSNTSLVNLYCRNNKLKTLVYNNAFQLELLDCSNNLLPSIDLKSSNNFRSLNCSYNQLTALMVPYFQREIHINCSYNLLTKLSISDGQYFKKLDCSHNQLSSLLLQNIVIDTLNCSSNQLSSVALSSYLSYLDFSNNKIASVDLSKSTGLARLYCFSNQLTQLDVSKNLSITDFDSQNNPLLHTICVASYQSTATWLEDTMVNFSSYCNRVKDSTLRNDVYVVSNMNDAIFLEVLSNDLAYDTEHLYIDLQPDQVGIQQYLPTALGEFKVIAKNKLYFSPTRDTVGRLDFKYDLVDSAGIAVSSSALISVFTRSELKFYSGFSPNGDSENPCFFITNVRPNSILSLNVYDLNGFEIYTNANYDNKWEGVSNDGEKVSPGTYYYIVKYQESPFPNEAFSTIGNQQYKGFVEIKY